MIKTVLNKLLIINLISIILFAGCITTRETQVRKSDTLYPSVLPFETIEQTIVKFKNILNTVDLPAYEREMITSFISRCEELKSLERKSTSTQDYRKAFTVLLEEAQRAYERLADPEQAYSVIHEYSMLKNDISNSFLVGDYRQVVNLCMEMEKRFGKKSMTPETGTMYAISLAENGMLRKAIDIGEHIIRETAALPDLIHLISGIIRWELETGNREKALEKYEKLIDSMTERNALYNRTAVGISTEAKGIRTEKRPFGEESDTSDRSTEIQTLLDDVETLLANEAYGEARLLLLRWRLSAEDGPEIELIENALKMVEHAENRSESTFYNEDIILTEANDLIEKEKYEEALSILEPLTVNPLYHHKEAERLREITIERLIRRDQMKAGEYFLMARNSNDRVEKRKLLNYSLGILNNLIEEYPLSPLTDRINSHIRRVREELESLN